MKILIAYDGSTPSGVALDKLREAGLPHEADVMILTIVDVWFSDANSTARDQEEYFASARKDALKIAVKAKSKLQAMFSSWKIQTKVLDGSPSSIIICQAKQWRADLIVMGSHGRSLLNRLGLGSVSQSVVTHASCSVLICRSIKRSSRKGARILIGTDGSTHAKAAINMVASGRWPKGSEVRVISVFDPNHYTSGIVINIEAEQAYRWFERSIRYAERKLRKKGLTVTGKMAGGNPKQVIVHEAKKWPADVIYLGATGLSRLERILLLGSVSISVAMRAHCSVAIVRG